jgi:nitrogen fixation NifU-like protein
MTEIRELYQEIVLDHNSRPRNFKEVPDADRVVDGFNPLCGDRIKLSVKLDGGHIQDIGFKGSGCAISRASASLMTQEVKGKTVEEAERLFQRFHALVTGARNGAGDAEDLGDLEVMGGVAEFPSRVKCATLAWHTLRAALEGKEKQVSSE